MGDFNIDILQYGENPRATEYVDLLFSFGLLQLVVRPTRCNKNSATLIDHVITDINLPVYKTNIIPLRISDHFPLIFVVPCKKKEPVTQKTFQVRDFSTANENKFRNTLNSINWNVVRDSDGTQMAFNTFSDIFNNLFDLHFPFKTIKFNKNIHKKDPWMSKGLLVSRMQKLKLSTLASKNPTDINTNNF